MHRIQYAFILPVLALIISCEKTDSGDKSGNGEDVTGYETVQGRSQKRGVCFNFAQLPDMDFPLLGPAISWYYDWSSNEPSSAVGSYIGEYGIEFCPMIWNGNYNPDNIRNYKRNFPQAEYILAFNEPNLVDQAAMTPAQAASYWPDVVALAEELDMKLISPAMNYGTLEGYTDPWTWLDEFLEQPGVSIDDIDGIAVHCYMTAPSSVISYIDAFRKYGKPIWLTEFCAGDTGNVSETAQMKYMSEMLNYLEADTDVFRYAWFIPRGGPLSGVDNALLTDKIPIGLTDLGTVYVNMSTQDKSVWYGISQVIPAEHYSSVSGAVHLRPVTDVSGILEVHDFKSGTYVEYQIDVPAAEGYTLDLRYSSFADVSVSYRIDGGDSGAIDLADTSNAWATVSIPISLEEGRHTLRLEGMSSSPICINWLRFK